MRSTLATSKAWSRSSSLKKKGSKKTFYLSKASLTGTDVTTRSSAKPLICSRRQTMNRSRTTSGQRLLKKSLNIRKFSLKISTSSRSRTKFRRISTKPKLFTRSKRTRLFSSSKRSLLTKSPLKRWFCHKLRSQNISRKRPISFYFV